MPFLDDKIREVEFSFPRRFWNSLTGKAAPYLLALSMAAGLGCSGRAAGRPGLAEHYPSDEGVVKEPDAGLHLPDEGIYDIGIDAGSAGCSLGFILIPGGTFTMGSNTGDPDERPPHSVTISQDYYLSEHEVTQAEYQEFTEATRLAAPSIGEAYRGNNRPVVEVTWRDASAYCEWIGGRLPTEAEWERAARGEDGVHEYSTDDGNLTSPGVHRNDSRPRDVCGGCGDYVVWERAELCDLSGSVWEWVSDWYGPYPLGPVTDPTGPASGERRVLRGGAWFYGGANPFRAARRSGADPFFDDAGSGFRCAIASENF